MLSLSIIVPATGRQEELDSTLVSILENRPRNCEILVPHADSYHDPYELGDEVRFVRCSSNAIIDLYNAGICASRADVVHLLSSGSEVSDRWTDSPRERLEADTTLAAVSPKLQEPDSSVVVMGVRYGRGGSRRVITGRRSQRSLPKIDAPCLHAAFFRSAVLTTVGGLDGTLDDYYAEVDLAAELRRQQLKCEHDPDSGVVGLLTRRAEGFRTARQMEQVYWRHAAAHGRLVSLLLHVTTIATQMVPQLVSPRVLASGCGHLVGTAECLIRGSNQKTLSSDTSTVEPSSTIRLHVPEADDADASNKMDANRRGA